MNEVNVLRRKMTCYKFTQSVATSILFDVQNGSPLSFAAVANGIGERRMRKIVVDGNADLERGIDTDYACFVKRLREIQQSEIQSCRLAAKNAEKGHRGAEWTLERVYQKEFGSNVELREMSEQIEEIKRNMLNIKAEKEVASDDTHSFEKTNEENEDARESVCQN